MTARMYYDADADPRALDGQTVAIIGYGSQGHAHALNLRDSGVDVVVGLAPGSKSRALAEAAGLRVEDVADAVKAADVIMIAVPDTSQKAVYDTEIEPNLRPGQLLMFAHGFNIRFARIQPAATSTWGWSRPRARATSCAASTSRAAACRRCSRSSRTRRARRARGPWPTPAGSGRPAPGVLETTFKEETETDLFGEQALLCGGVSALVKAAFETLVEAGYQPELAYFETMHELKLIVDLMYRGGLNYMRFSVSDTAEFGDYVSGPRVTEGAKAAMKDVLTDIQSGSFATAGSRSRRPAARSSAGCARGTATTRSSRSGPTSGRRCRSSTRSSSRPARRRPTTSAGTGGGGRAMTFEATQPRFGGGVAAGSVRIFDTTLRDGEQAPGAGLTAAEKLEVARQLARLRVDVIEAGFPAASPGDFEAVRRIAQETKGGIAVAALARCRDGDPQRAVEAIGVAERPHLHLFIATSDIHLKHKLKMSREDALADARKWVSWARETLGRDAEIEFSAEDASRTEESFLLEVYQAVVEAGASTVNIPDTVGYAIPAEFGALVGRVVDLVGRDATVSVHCHNDLGLATANTLAAVQAGARQVEVTINGLGERAGNASLEEVVMALRTRPNQFPELAAQVQTEQLTPASRLVSYLTGLRRPAQQGDRRRQRLRARVGHPPGRVPQEPADLRDHDPAVRRAVGQHAVDRQAVRPARAAGQARASSATRSTARRSTRSTARRSRWPTRRRTSPTRTWSRSSSSATADVPRSIELLGWNISSSSGGHSVGSASLVVAGEAQGRPRHRQRARERAVRARSTRPSSRSSAGTRCSRSTRSRPCPRARTRRARCSCAAAGRTTRARARSWSPATGCRRTSSRRRSRPTSSRPTSSTAPRSTGSRSRSSAGASAEELP